MVNFMVWWDADLLRELLDGHNNDVENPDAYSASQKPVTTPPWIGKWNYVNSTINTILTADGTYSNNGTKATPCLSADILGDWREEVIWRTSDNTALRIYTTTIPATNRIYTLMHDPQYRLGIAWQNGAYNQPPHTGFYLGDGMAEPPRPQIKILYGDLTGDNNVDINDVSEFSKVWLATDCNNVELDFNGDCIINLYEFSLLAKDWLDEIQ
jgi:rhamnogalacturonan endolyase